MLVPYFLLFSRFLLHLRRRLLHRLLYLLHSLLLLILHLLVFPLFHHHPHPHPHPHPLLLLLLSPVLLLASLTITIVHLHLFISFTGIIITPLRIRSSGGAQPQFSLANGASKHSRRLLPFIRNGCCGSVRRF
jgi:hypothetical protein